MSGLGLLCQICHSLDLAPTILQNDKGIPNHLVLIKPTYALKPNKLGQLGPHLVLQPGGRSAGPLQCEAGAPAQPPSQPSRSRLVYMAEISVKRRLGRFKKFAVMEPLIERVVYEDIPLVLEAIRERVSTQQVLVRGPPAQEARS